MVCATPLWTIQSMASNGQYVELAFSGCNFGYPLMEIWTATVSGHWSACSSTRASSLH